MMTLTHKYTHIERHSSHHFVGGSRSPITGAAPAAYASHCSERHGRAAVVARSRYITYVRAHDDDALRVGVGLG